MPGRHQAASCGLRKCREHQALRGFVWVDAPVKTPAWRRRHSRRACFPGQGRGGPPRGRCRHTMAVGALESPDATRAATVYTNGPKRRREAIFVDLCTLLRLRACPQRRNSVHKWPKTAPRGRFRQSVYTLLHPHDRSRLHPHGRSRDRAGPRVPRHQRPHGPVTQGRSDLTPTSPGR